MYVYLFDLKKSHLIVGMSETFQIDASYFFSCVHLFVALCYMIRNQKKIYFEHFNILQLITLCTAEKNIEHAETKKLKDIKQIKIK